MDLTNELMGKDYKEEFKKEFSILLNKPNEEEREQKLFNLAERNNLEFDEILKAFNSVFEDTLRERIKEFIGSNLSPLERQLKKQQVKNWLRGFFNDTKDINSLMDYYTAAEEEIIVCTIRQALDLRTDRNRYLVDGLLLTGALYLIAAAPKTGKSLYATDLAVTCCLGNTFLNRRVQPNTNVLFLQNEENITEAANRAYTNGLQNLELENPEMFKTITETNRFTLVKNLDIIQDLKKIFDLVTKYDIGLVVVDSLSASVKKGGLNEHSPELLSGLLTFQQHIQDRGITGLLIHHTIKSDNNENQQEMIKGIAGRNDISRANDGIIKMSASKDAKGHLNLYFLPRNGQQCSFVVKQSVGEACYWKYEVVEEDTLSPENVTIQNKILRVLKERYNQWQLETNGEKFPIYGYHLSELERSTSLDRDILVERLNYMLSIEGIERTGVNRKHLYHYPLRGESWLDQYLEAEDKTLRHQKELLNLDLKRKDGLLELKTKEEIKAFTKDWTIADGQRVFNTMSAEEQNNMNLIMYPPKYPVGTLVIVDVDIHRSQKGVIGKIIYNKALQHHQYYVDGIDSFSLESNLRICNPEDEAALELEILSSANEGSALMWVEPNTEIDDSDNN